METYNFFNMQDEVYCDQIVYFDTRLQKWHRPEVAGWIPIGRRSLSACKNSNRLLLI